MASFFYDEEDKLQAPLNISAAAPVLDLKGFCWQAVDETDPSQFLDGHAEGRVDGQHPFAVGSTALEHSATAAPPCDTSPVSPRVKTVKTEFGIETIIKSGAKFPLDNFTGTYAGNGFNMIFRPRAAGSNEKTENLEKNPKGPSDNILEINLTTEQLSFGSQLGDIPNRGLDKEPDIHLAGVPYLQTVQDRTNEQTGRGNNPDKTDIHFEPGVFLHVPASGFQNKKASIVRMATIPHGTTVNAQCFVPERDCLTAKPTFDKIDTTPFKIGNESAREIDTFSSMDAGNQETFRIPQNLHKFDEHGTGKITTDIIKNPNRVLEKAIKGLDIKETITFEVNTEPVDPDLLGGGTTNIAFLGGTPEFNKQNELVTGNPTAQAVSMKARYWVERVLYNVTVPVVKPNGTVNLRATLPTCSTAPTPVFQVTVGPNGNKTKKDIKIHGTQIQVSQQVLLNFKNLSWPHVSVSTLVPKSPQPFQMY
jgi:hypothetical protein